MTKALSHAADALTHAAEALKLASEAFQQALEAEKTEEMLAKANEKPMRPGDALPDGTLNFGLSGAVTGCGHSGRLKRTDADTAI